MERISPWQRQGLNPNAHFILLDLQLYKSALQVAPNGMDLNFGQVYNIY